MNHVRAWLRRIGWPYYECEQCVGQEYWQACYCAYHGAYSPCGPEDAAPWYARLARWTHRRIWGEW